MRLKIGFVPSVDPYWPVTDIILRTCGVLSVSTLIVFKFIPNLVSGYSLNIQGGPNNHEIITLYSCYNI